LKCHPCRIGLQGSYLDHVRLRERLGRLFRSIFKPLGKEELGRQWDHAFQSSRLPSPSPPGEGWDSVDVVDPGDLLMVASVARACALVKGQMRVAGVAGQEAFGVPLPPRTKQDVPAGESFERPVPLHWLLEYCKGPVRGIRLRAPGNGLGVTPVPGVPTTLLPVEELERMLRLGGLESFGLWGYTLQPPQRPSGQGQPEAVALGLSNATLSQFDLHECTTATELVLDGGANGPVDLDVRLNYCDALTSLTVRGKRVGSVYAFGCRLLTTLDCVDTSMRRLPDVALGECPRLIEVKLPTTLRCIGDYTFNGCVALAKVILPRGVTHIGEGAFKRTALQEMQIPDAVEIIGESAFAETELVHVALPRGLTSLGASAFEHCGSLLSVDGLTRGATKLTSVPPSAFKFCYSLAEVVLPPGVTSIGGDAFCMCIRLVDTQIPNGVTRIGRKAFASSGLVHVVLPTTLEELGASAFESTPLVSVDLGSTSLGSVPKGAFRHCNALAKVTLPPGVTRIGKGAFEGTILTEIQIPGGVRQVTASLFKDCVALTTVTLPAKLVEIGDGAFEGCVAMTQIELPVSLETLGRRAFAECGLRRVDLGKCVGLRHPDHRPSVDANGYATDGGAFDGCSQLSEVVLPVAWGADHVAALGLHGFEFSSRGPSGSVFRAKPNEPRSASGAG